MIYLIQTISSSTKFSSKIYGWDPITTLKGESQVYSTTKWWVETLRVHFLLSRQQPCSIISKIKLSVGWKPLKTEWITQWLQTLTSWMLYWQIRIYSLPINPARKIQEQNEDPLGSFLFPYSQNSIFLYTSESFPVSPLFISFLLCLSSPLNSCIHHWYTIPWV